MKLNITYRHLEPTEAISQRIESKANHLNKYFQGNVELKWVCSIEGQRHMSDVTALSAHGKFHAHSEDENLYKTFDEVIDKLERQLSKKMNKIRRRIHPTKNDHDSSEDVVETAQ